MKLDKQAIKQLGIKKGFSHTLEQRNVERNHDGHEKRMLAFARHDYDNEKLARMQRQYDWREANMPALIRAEHNRWNRERNASKQPEIIHCTDGANLKFNRLIKWLARK